MDPARNRVSIERKNLALVCSLSVKTLIDKSCYMTLDEQSEEFLNFCIILEHVFNHQFKPRLTWYRGRDLGGVWDYVNQACKSVPNNCLRNLSNFEHIKTGHGKVRAWVRVSLMEKRLSEYISAAICQRDLTGQFYGAGGLLLSEEADLLTKSLLGLNAIDFSFDLKSANLDAPGCTVIDYSPYLYFTQCPESVVEDARELRGLSVSSRDESSAFTPEGQLPEFGVERGSPDGKAPDTPQHVPNAVVANCQGGNDGDDALNNDQYRTIVQQKGYLEELLRLRESQLRAEKQDRRTVAARLVRLEGEKAREMHQMETVVIELQAQMQTLKNDYHRLQRHVIMTSQGRRSSVPKFRYSARDQRMHSFSSDTDNQVPTAEEAATLLPPETAEPSAERRRSPTQEIDCDLVAPEPARILSSSAESRDDPVTMNVEAVIHHNSCDDEHEQGHTDSPIADLLAVKRGYYNLGADVDRDSSEDRNTRGSSEECEESDVTRATSVTPPSDVFRENTGSTVTPPSDVFRENTATTVTPPSDVCQEDTATTVTPPSDVCQENTATTVTPPSDVCQENTATTVTPPSDVFRENTATTVTPPSDVCQENTATTVTPPSDVCQENTATTVTPPSDVCQEDTATTVTPPSDVCQEDTATTVTPPSDVCQENTATTVTPPSDVGQENTATTDTTEDLLNGNSDDNRFLNSAEKDENCNDSLNTTPSKGNENDSVNGNTDNNCVAVSD